MLFRTFGALIFMFSEGMVVVVHMLVPLSGGLAETYFVGWNYFEALYFCFVAFATIGYGDVTPLSISGRQVFSS